LTLQLATDPTTQYEFSAKPLAPPQKNPPKPTPLSGKAKNTNGYNASQDTFTYLTAPSASGFAIRTTNKVTTGLDVLPSAKADSLESIRATMAAVSARMGEDIRNNGITIEESVEDPDKVRLEAMEAEKQKLRAQRRLEKQKNKEAERNNRVFNSRRMPGLTLGGLEDEEDMGGRPRASRPKPRKSRRDSYSEEEEEMYGRLGGPQDAYEKDDFVVDSDDDEEGDGEDEDAEGEDDIDAIIEHQERRQSPKRSRPDEVAAPASPVARTKRRRVVSDDDDEDE
jgi:RNA polymerase-associated protein LEO1